MLGENVSISYKKGISNASMVNGHGHGANDRTAVSAMSKTHFESLSSSSSEYRLASTC